MWMSQRVGVLHTAHGNKRPPPLAATCLEADATVVADGARRRTLRDREGREWRPRVEQRADHGAVSGAARGALLDSRTGRCTASDRGAPKRSRTEMASRPRGRHVVE
jgi:hypothetical protein